MSAVDFQAFFLFQDMLRQLGLPTDARLESLLFAYLHLSEILPAEFLEFLSVKSQVDLDVGAQVIETKLPIP